MKNKLIILILSLGLLLILSILFIRFTGFVNLTDTPETCFDSDGGDNPFERGTISGEAYDYIILAPRNFSEQDVCKRKDILKEYSCIEKESKSGYEKGLEYEKKYEHYLCKGECINGACKEIIKECSLSCQIRRAIL